MLASCQTWFTLGIKVCKIGLDICRLMEQPWLQLIFCVACLPHSCNFQDKKEVQNRVSTDWCITIKHWRLSSIEVIFVNYQTSELQCNYQFYIPRDTIEDAQGFRDIVLIAPSRGFSVKTLIGVQHCHRRLSWI